MIETWKQYTCDGCGETEFHPSPDVTNKEVREFLKPYGWRHYGLLDYCAECVRTGVAKKRITSMDA